MAPWAPEAGSKIICEEVVLMIALRDLQGPGVCEQGVSSLIKQQSVCTPEKELSIFGPAELALLVTRILKQGT